MNNVQISMVNTRGRVVWVDQVKVTALQEQGWRVIVNPKETYYPQYDASDGKKIAEDNQGTQIVSSQRYGNKLGIVVL